jgi:hypothetical protein
MKSVKLTRKYDPVSQEQQKYNDGIHSLENQKNLAS